MTRDYLDTPLGGLDRKRVAQAGINESMLMALRFHKYERREQLDKVKSAATEYLEDLEGPVRDLYELMLELATSDHRVWAPIPRLAGGEDIWHKEGDHTRRYTTPAVASRRRMDAVAVPSSAVNGLVAWGADDEDRLPTLGQLTLYLVAGDRHPEGAGSATVAKDFIRDCTTFGFNVEHGATQRQDVHADGFLSASTTVFRLTYSGRRKRKGSKLVGGYVGG